MTGLDWKPPVPPAAGLDRRRRCARGGSLLELLLAALMFGVALLGTAPLFVRAVADVHAGAVSSGASVLAVERLERLAAPGSPAAPAPGSSREFYSRTERRWLAAAPAPPDRAIWVASVTIRHFPLGSIDDGRLDPAEALSDSDWDSSAGPPPVRLESREVSLARTIDGRKHLILERFEWAVD